MSKLKISNGQIWTFNKPENAKENLDELKSWIGCDIGLQDSGSPFLFLQFNDPFFPRKYFIGYGDYILKMETADNIKIVGINVSPSSVFVEYLPRSGQ